MGQCFNDGRKSTLRGCRPPCSYRCRVASGACSSCKNLLRYRSGLRHQVFTRRAVPCVSKVEFIDCALFPLQKSTPLRYVLISRRRAGKRDCHLRYRYGNRLARGIAALWFMSELDAPQASTPPLRSRRFPRSRRSLKSPSPEPLQTLAAPLRRSCLLRRPDPPVRMSWRWWFYSWVVACSRGTVIPRISVVPPVACRADTGLPPCHFCRQ